MQRFDQVSVHPDAKVWSGEDASTGVELSHERAYLMPRLNFPPMQVCSHLLRPSSRMTRSAVAHFRDRSYIEGKRKSAATNIVSRTDKFPKRFVERVKRSETNPNETN